MPQRSLYGGEEHDEAECFQMLTHHHCNVQVLTGPQSHALQWLLREYNSDSLSLPLTRQPTQQDVATLRCAPFGKLYPCLAQEVSSPHFIDRMSRALTIIRRILVCCDASTLSRAEQSCVMLRALCCQQVMHLLPSPAGSGKTLMAVKLVAECLRLRWRASGVEMSF